MPNKSIAYDAELIDKISNKNNWPNIDSFLIVRLMRIANNAFNKETVDGKLSSVLIYHQIVEEFLINLLKLSNLYIQAEIWPNRLNLKVGNSLMFGQILREHEKTVDFDSKDELLLKCNSFNQTRIKYVHELLKFKNDDEIISAAKKIKDEFNEITELYFKGATFLEWILEDLKKRVDWKDMLDEI